MRDFPIFTTEYGVSSLTLKEIPYKKQAFIHIRDVQEDFFKENLAECVSFCRMCGAEAIFAAGHEKLEEYPLYTEVLEMRGVARSDPEKLRCLFPVTENTLKRWQEIYNEKMKNVDNAAYMSDKAAGELLKGGGAYFVHRDGKLLGIGSVQDDRIDCVASVEKGCGETVMLALIHALMCDRVVLEVASTNLRAIRLYERMGFIKTAEISSWYKII